MFCCKKCGAYISPKPSYERESIGWHVVESLRYRCSNCGYSWTTPTADARKKETN